MHKLRKVAAFTALLVFLSVLLTACGQAGSPSSQSGNTSTSRIDQIKKKGKLVLATGDYRPFEYHDEKTNQMVGYDIDLASAIAKKIGVPLEVKEMQFTSLIPTLQIGDADLVIAAMYITDARKQVVDFADPYMDTGMVLVTRAENTTIKSTSDLAGKTVGVKTGATSENVANDLKAKGVNMTIKSYKETVDYMLDLENGRLDAAINDLLNQLEYNKTHPKVKVVGEPFTKASLGIAVKKGDTELVTLINSVLKEMKQNGEADKLYKKWVTGQQ